MLCALAARTYTGPHIPCVPLSVPPVPKPLRLRAARSELVTVPVVLIVQVVLDALKLGIHVISKLGIQVITVNEPSCAACSSPSSSCGSA